MGRGGDRQYSLERLEDTHPTLHRALREGFEGDDRFDDFERFVDFERFWDAVRVMDGFGIDLTTAHADEVVCRECGAAVEGPVRDHLENRHGLGLGEYRREHPTAPANPRERAALPPARIDWDAGRD